MWRVFSSSRRFGKTDQQETNRIIYEVTAKPHKGELLDACANDTERRSLCLQWAGQIRTQWYDGLRAQIVYLLESDLPRYRQYSPAAKKKIAEQIWGRSVQAKDLAATEQMYSRWAMQYSGGPGA